MTQYMDFEKPLAEIEGKAEELRAMARTNEEMDVDDEASALDKKAAQLLKDLYADLTAWRKCQVARHPERPHCKDYIEKLFSEYTPLAGDRNFADDLAVMGGLARFNDQPVVVIGHEKGSDTKSRILHNFGMARPEGYRKALRKMKLAEKLGLPIVSLISFLIGMIFAFVGVMQLENFGAGIYTADLVAVAMVREMAPIMTAIIMAGRTGAAYAAEIGTMKVNEEIDALTTLGIDPIDFLVSPRVIALILMLPFLLLLQPCQLLSEVKTVHQDLG